MIFLNEKNQKYFQSLPFFVLFCLSSTKKARISTVNEFGIFLNIIKRYLHLYDFLQFSRENSGMKKLIIEQEDEMLLDYRVIYSLSIYQLWKITQNFLAIVETDMLFSNPIRRLALEEKKMFFFFNGIFASSYVFRAF